MDELNILFEFNKWLKEKPTTSKYFIIQGYGGVGKSFLLDKIQKSLINDNYFAISINSDNVINEFMFWKSIIQQILEKGYHGSYFPQLQDFNSTFFNDFNTRTENLNHYQNLPLFSNLEVQKPNNDTILFSKVEIRSLISCVIREIINQTEVVLFVDFSINNSEIEDLLKEVNSQVFFPFIVIASRKKLPIFWPTENDHHNFFILEPYDKTNVMKFLQENNIRQETIAEDIYSLTGGYIGFLSETLTYWNNKNYACPKVDKKYRQYISRRINECHLREVKCIELGELIKLSALCKPITINNINLISDKKFSKIQFEKLINCSFILIDNGMLKILPVLYQALIFEWLMDFPTQFQNNNSKLLKYLRRIEKRSSINDKFQVKVGILFHQIFIDENLGLTYAQKFVQELEEQFASKALLTLLDELLDYPHKSESFIELLPYWKALKAQLLFRWEEAEVNYRQLIIPGKKATIRGFGHYGLGQIQQYKGNWDEAENHFLAAVDFFASTHNSELRLKSMILQANMLFRKHFWVEAEKVLKKASETKNLLKDENYHFLIDYNFGKLARSKGDWLSAVEFLSSALKKSFEIENNNFEGNVYYEFGKLYRTQGEWDKSIDNFGKCLNSRKKLEDLLGEAICLHSLGTALLRKGDIEEAKKNYEESLKIKEMIVDHYGRAKSLNGLGHVARLSGDFLQAVNYYQKAVEIYSNSNNKTKAGRILCRLGMTYAEQGLWEKAGKYLRESQLFRRRNNDIQGVSESLYELGCIQEEQDDTHDALDSFRLSAKLAKESSSIGRELSSDAALVRTLVKLQSSNSAIQAAQEARLLASAYNRFQNLANEYWKWGWRDYKKGLFTVAFFCFAETIDCNLSGGFDSSSYCSETINGIEQIINISGIEEGNKFSRQMIQQWEDLSLVGGIIHRVIAIEYYESRSKTKDFLQFKRICKILRGEE